MSAALPGNRDLPTSQYDLNTYWGRVKQSAEISDPRTLFVSTAGLENAKKLVSLYKQGHVKSMTPELWRAKKIVDSTLHPDTGQPVLLPFRMSCFVISNLVVTAGMLTPNLKVLPSPPNPPPTTQNQQLADYVQQQTRGILFWQITNQSLNVAINSANANKSTPLSTSTLFQSYLLAVSASCSVALGLNALVPRLRRVSPTTKILLTRLVPFAAVASAGALNVFLMRVEEIRRGIDVFRVLSEEERKGKEVQSLGKSRKAATLAVGETALSRVFNSTPIMVLPALVLVRMQRTEWLKRRPRLTLPLNLGLILTTSIFALPLALAVFPQRQAVDAMKLEECFWERGGKDGKVEFNRGI